MSSKNIYSGFKPTYLYIKQHSITKLKYFGKTTKENPYTYLGSGKYWLAHIKKHGVEYVETIWVSELYTDKARLVEFAINFSETNDIIKSDKWANLIVENGLDGGSMKGRKLSEETRMKISNSKLGHATSEETRKRLSMIMLGNKACGRLGELHPNYKKSPSLETRMKISASLCGISQPPELIAKRVDKISKTWKLTSPNGEEFIIKNLNSFCKDNKLCSSTLIKVANKKRSHYKDWKCERIN